MSKSIKDIKTSWQKYSGDSQDFSLNLSVELYEEDGEFYIYIGEDSSSGYKKKISTTENVADIIKDYLDSFYK